MDRSNASPDVSTLPGPGAEHRVAHHMTHAATSTYVYEFVWDITQPAIGPFCTDVDGNILLDFTSHVGAAPLGYNNPTLLDSLSEFDIVDPLKIAGQDFYTSIGNPTETDLPGAGELMERLIDVSPPAHDTVFLTNSGAEAVENAIKITYDATAGQYGITFNGAFHGRTLGALSLNRSKSVHRRHFPEIAGVHDVPFCRDSTCEPETCGCGFFTDSGSILRDTIDPDAGIIHPDDLAYIILEPVQGEGGLHIPSQAFIDEISRLQTTHNIPIISDEIQSGMGRTGTFWASDDFPLTPDVICAGKAARVGATIAPSDMFPSTASRLSSTWGGGAILDMLQGALTIDIIHEQNLLDNAKAKGTYLVELLEDAAFDQVTEIRGKGLLVGMEFANKAIRDAVLEEAFSRGLLTLGCGTSTLRLLPPLDVTERELQMAVDIVSASIKNLHLS